MTKSNLKYFNKRLVQELNDLVGGADCSFDALNDPEENLADIVDRASSLIERSLSQNICDREKLKIRKIEQSLNDLANGDYGICEQCGEDIAIKRLKVNPVARHCIECKTMIEIRERLTVDQ
jgi:DnaK suppressor protein